MFVAVIFGDNYSSFGYLSLLLNIFYSIASNQRKTAQFGWVGSNSPCIVHASSTLVTLKFKHRSLCQSQIALFYCLSLLLELYFHLAFIFM